VSVSGGVNTSKSLAVSTDQPVGTVNVAPPGDTFALSAGANNTHTITRREMPFLLPRLRIFMESTSREHFDRTHITQSKSSPQPF
jgi:hypothetical protein